MKDSAKRLLIFTIREKRYAMALHDVAEVMEPPLTYYPIPRAPDWLKGAMNFHGNLVSVLDLARFMETGSAMESGKILVMDGRIANLALWVDRVENIVSEDAVVGEEESDEALVAGSLSMTDGEVKLLAVESLLAKLEATING